MAASIVGRAARAVSRALGGGDGAAAARQRAADDALADDLDRLSAATALRARLAAGRADLVMGLAIGYGAAELAPFLRSLRASGYGGGITLFVSAADEGTLALFAETGVTPVPFLAVRSMPMSMNSARMLRHLDRLGELALNAPAASAPGRILLCDVRDVVFQGDPFAALGDARLRFHLETGPALGACDTNGAWLERGFGRAARAELAERHVACAGTLLGTAEAVFDYLIAMIRLLITVPAAHRHSGVDQAAHNLILWRGLVAGAEAVANGQEVLTVPARGLRGVASLESDGTIRNADGSVSQIVHQYDRDRAALAAVRARWLA